MVWRDKDGFRPKNPAEMADRNLEIFRLVVTGGTYKVIGERFGLGQARVGGIVQRYSRRILMHTGLRAPNACFGGGAQDVREHPQFWLDALEKYRKLDKEEGNER